MSSSSYRTPIEWPTRLVKTFNGINEFQKIKEIGSGAFSTVYSARHKSTGKVYAIKEIGYDDKLNIKNEIVLHSELNHPNIVKFYDWFKEGEKIMMILEHCEGGTMFRYLDNNHKLPTDVIRKFIYESCLALLYLHERGIVHRDIKPENLLLDEKLNVKLCDFGWCSHISKIKQTNSVCGTHEYMAPEILKGEQHDESVDIWAIGILLYELFHNKEPFSGNTPKSVLAKILNFDISYDSHFPHSAKSLMLDILKLDKRNRLNLRDILKDSFLRGIGNGQSIDAVPNEFSGPRHQINNPNPLSKQEIRSSDNIRQIGSFQETRATKPNLVYHQSLYRNLAPNQYQTTAYPSNTASDPKISETKPSFSQENKTNIPSQTSIQTPTSTINRPGLSRPPIQANNVQKIVRSSWTDNTKINSLDTLAPKIVRGSYAIPNNIPKTTTQRSETNINFNVRAQSDAGAKLVRDGSVRITGVSDPLSIPLPSNYQSVQPVKSATQSNFRTQSFHNETGITKNPDNYAQIRIHSYSSQSSKDISKPVHFANPLKLVQRSIDTQITATESGYASINTPSNVALPLKTDQPESLYSILKGISKKTSPEKPKESSNSAFKKTQNPTQIVLDAASNPLGTLQFYQSSKTPSANTQQTLRINSDSTTPVLQLQGQQARYLHDGHNTDRNVNDKFMKYYPKTIYSDAQQGLSGQNQSQPSQLVAETPQPNSSSNTMILKKRTSYTGSILENSAGKSSQNILKVEKVSGQERISENYKSVTQLIGEPKKSAYASTPKRIEPEVRLQINSNRSKNLFPSNPITPSNYSSYQRSDDIRAYNYTSVLDQRLPKEPSKYKSFSTATPVASFSKNTSNQGSATKIPLNSVSITDAYKPQQTSVTSNTTNVYSEQLGQDLQKYRGNLIIETDSHLRSNSRSYMGYKVVSGNTSYTPQTTTGSQRSYAQLEPQQKTPLASYSSKNYSSSTNSNQAPQTNYIPQSTQYSSERSFPLRIAESQPRQNGSITANQTDSYKNAKAGFFTANGADNRGTFIKAYESTGNSASTGQSSQIRRIDPGQYQYLNKI